MSLLQDIMVHGSGQIVQDIISHAPANKASHEAAVQKVADLEKQRSIRAAAASDKVAKKPDVVLGDLSIVAPSNANPVAVPPIKKEGVIPPIPPIKN